MTPRHQPATAASLASSTDAARAARADMLARIVAGVLDQARPPLATTVWTARTALEELRAMALAALATDAPWSPTATLERLARDAGLPEFESLEFRRAQGQPMTEPERLDWERIARFAALVAAAAIDACSSNRTPGAGPAAAT